METLRKIIFSFNINSEKKINLLKSLYIESKERFFRFGKTGSSDLLLFLPKAKTIFLECKSGKNKLTKDQEEFKDHVEKLDFTYLIKRDNKDIDKLLKI
jgi:hypothetical protein